MSQFQPWFVNVLMHELAHGLGPESIKLPSGEATTVSQQLKDLYSAIEEAKADVTGLHNLTVLQQQGVYDAEFVRRAYIGHVADLFRCVRFGTSEAHGQGCLLQFNYLVQNGALRYDAAASRYDVDRAKLVTANRALAAEILTVQGEGSYQKANDLLTRYGTVSPELKAVLAKLSTVPVDVKPEHTVLQKMKSW